MEHIKETPALSRTGAPLETSNDQEASSSSLAGHTAQILDFDLRDLDPNVVSSPAYHREHKARLRENLSSHGLRDELVDHMSEAVYGMERTLAWAAHDKHGHYPPDQITRKVKWGLRFVFNFLADDSSQATEAERAAVLSILDGYLGEFLDGGVAQALADFETELAAQRRREAIDRMAEVYGRSHFEDVDQGGDPLGDAQGPPPAVWGGGSDVLWSSGEALIIEADIGVGKTTLGGLLVRALLFGGEVLGQPVKQLAPGQRVLYLALDRPDQIKRSLSRQFTPEQRAALRDRLVVWGKPLPADPAENPNVLRDLSEFLDAAVVVVDSLKDAAVGLSDERVAAAYNGARKRLLATGRQLVELHHLTKGGTDYGSVFIPAEAGSIVRLSGRASGTTGTLTHRKSPAHIVGPLKVVHDRDHGEIDLRAATAPATGTEAQKDKAATVEKNLVEWVRSHGREGVTAASGGVYLYRSGEWGNVEKARRVLDKHAVSGELVRVEGARGGLPTRWAAVEACSEITNHV
jgi:hypothetical protein